MVHIARENGIFTGYMAARGQDSIVTGNSRDLEVPANRSRAVDIHVGKRLRQRRTLLGLSQEKLAEALGLTFQQVHKYEKGVTRVGASRLFDLSRVLDVPIGYFFDGIATTTTACAPPTGTPTMSLASPELKRETLDLVRAYNDIRDPQMRRRIHELAKALADS